MKKIVIAALLVLPTALMGQDLDPTVEVSREYEGKLIDVHKPSLTMTVPDTLYRFDLDFDYSVFDSPYKGSYEFSPYVMEVMPASAGRDARTFYLKAGAGYTLHPVLDLLWSPVSKGAFGVDVYGLHRSYIGEYRGIGQKAAWNGYDLLSHAGADFRYDWKKVSLDFGASYYGVADNDYRRSRSYNALDAFASLKSKLSWPEHFSYEASLAYRYAKDNPAGMSSLTGHEVKLDASFGPSFGGAGRLLFDLDLELDSYAGAVAASVGRFCFSPHYVYSKGIFRIDAGVSLSVLMNTGVSFAGRGQYVYPDVHMSLKLIPDAMKMYVHIGGGDKVNTYSSLIGRNHHLDQSYGLSGAASLMNVSFEKLSSALGFEGRISSFLSYDVRAGYVNYGSAVLDAAVMGEDGLYVPAVGYAPYQKWFASVAWNLNTQSFRFDGTVSYNRFWGMEEKNLLLPSAFDADVSALYNWNGRIYAGLDCMFASSRVSGTGFSVPWYLDLGVYAEYALSRRISFWLRGGNLLDMEIQRNLLYAEKGINFTAGICLNL